MHIGIRGKYVVGETGICRKKCLITVSLYDSRLDSMVYIFLVIKRYNFKLFIRCVKIQYDIFTEMLSIGLFSFHC